jgi:hypothetical protein
MRIFVAYYGYKQGARCMDSLFTERMMVKAIAALTRRAKQSMALIEARVTSRVYASLTGSGAQRTRVGV